MNRLHLVLSAVAVVSLFIACGFQEPFQPAGACNHVDGGPYIATEDERDCECLEHQVGLAMATLERDAGVDPAAFPAATIWLYASDDTYNLIGNAEGRYIPGPGRDGQVLEERYGRGILHELLHHWQIWSGVPVNVSAAHVGWVDNGYFKLATDSVNEVEANRCL